MRALTSSSGQVANRYDYDAYGKLLTSSGTVANPFRYAGEYTDTESGLIYLRARYYDPGTQQFLSRDPQEGASGQPYAYAAGSPLNATDPTGRLAWFVPVIAGAIFSYLAWSAVGVGIDYLSDPTDFDLGRSVVGQLTSPWNLIALVPGGVVGKLLQIGRLSRLGLRSSKVVAVIGEVDEAWKFYTVAEHETVWNWLAGREWNIALNKEWIGSVAKRGMDVKLVSRVTKDNMRRAFDDPERLLYGPRTVFNQEILQLKNLGYRYSVEGTEIWMRAP